MLFVACIPTQKKGDALQNPWEGCEFDNALVSRRAALGRLTSERRIMPLHFRHIIDKEVPRPGIEPGTFRSSV